MSWLRAAALRVNKRLGSEGGALLALTRVDVANNELRTLPAELFTLLSLRYLNAAQNKLERLPRAGDPLEDEPKRGKKRRAADNRLEELPPELFHLPALQTLDVSNNKLRVLPCSVWSAPALRDLNAALNHLRDLPQGDENAIECSSPSALSPSESSPQLSAERSVTEHFTYDAATSKNSSRSPSIERSECDTLDDDDAPIVIANRGGNAVWSEARRPHAWRGELDAADAPAAPASSTASAGSRLAALNLSHNQFTCVPAPLACRAPHLTRLNMAYNSLRCRRLHLSHNQFTCVPAPLACRAPHLTRLNMAYNSLRSMSYVTSYPTSLRQLDLSHNEITCWPSLPQIESFGSTEGDPLACYCPNPTGRSRPRSGGSVRSQLLSAACPARRHLRLEGLRTLVSSNSSMLRS
ncbi:hypothetical protein ABMA28_012781 [Loxostege sticticalis]|uniref:Uncharacterized protein n=1 Tax=Loxostege sticticalis TaxID=481309 RepID=A0ABD0S2I7_LOXSC